MTMDSREQRLRRHAKTLGLRVVKRDGSRFDLLNGEGLVTCGPIDTVAAYVNDRYVRPKPTPRRAQPPAAWAPIIEDYLVSLTAGGASQITLTLRRQHLTQMSREVVGSPAEITAEHLIEWMGRHTEWAPEYRRSHRNSAHSFFLWAYRTRRIAVHIADDLPRVRSHVGPPRPAPDTAWRAALAAATPRVALMMRLAAEAGLRRAEVAQVHTRDLTEGASGYSLLVHGKGNKKRIVPISDSLAAAIRSSAASQIPAGVEPDCWLFPNGTGGHLDPKRVGAIVNAALPDTWTMHTLRHRFATRAYRGSSNLRAVQTLLGHASVATTQRYTAVDDDEVRAAMEAASA